MNSLIDNQQPIMTRIYVALRKSDADFLSQIQSYSRVHLLEEDARRMTEEDIARLMRGLTRLQHYLYSRVGHEAYWTQTMFPPILSAEREFKGHSVLLRLRSVVQALGPPPEHIPRRFGRPLDRSLESEKDREGLRGSANQRTQSRRGSSVRI